MCFFDSPPARKCRFFDWRRWALLAFFCRLGVDLGNLGLKQPKWPKKTLKHDFCCKMMKKWPIFEKWASRCPNSAEFHANSAEFRGRGVLHVRKSQKKGHFPRKIVKKGTFWEVFQPEFRGIPRRFRKPPKSAKFGILTLKLTEIRKLQLLRWIREEAGLSFVRVSSHAISPSKSQVSARRARISGKVQKLWSIQAESALWHHLSAFPRVRSEKHS